MILHHLLLLAAIGQATKVEVEGQVSLKLHAPVVRAYQNSHEDLESVKEKIKKEPPLLGDKDLVLRGYDQMTVAPMVECMYQIPEESQAHALLSNMMNELTKMFVKADEMVKGNYYRRRGETRFRVISKKNTNFFEDVYGNMTRQYLSIFNSTTVRVDRSGRTKDPCENQEEIKGMWKELLDSSLMTFRQAALKCIDEHLKNREESIDPTVKSRMSQYLLREMGKIKLRQLTHLCDKFQLCFDELMRRNVR